MRKLLLHGKGLGRRLGPSKNVELWLLYSKRPRRHVVGHVILSFFEVLKDYEEAEGSEVPQHFLSFLSFKTRHTS